MKSCLFCKIVKGEIPCYKIYEDENAIGILDVFPNTKGQTLVISKKHFPSDFSKMPDKEFKSFVLTAKKVSQLLKGKLGVNRVALVIEGTGVNHIHAKLYPLHGLDEKFRPAEASEKVYYDKYPGFIDTRLGKKADNKELKELARKIKEF